MMKPLPLQYSPLTSKSHIRLLRVRELRGSIQYSLKVVDRIDVDKPYYDCLSYTWGNPLYEELFAGGKNTDTEKSPEIIISDEFDIEYTLKVGINLAEALKQMASYRRAEHADQLQEFIWIDAICINQGNPAERSSQVEMMKEIYQGAQKVIIWLGPEDLTGEDGINTLKQLSKIKPEELETIPTAINLRDGDLYESLGIDYIVPDDWQSLVVFLKRSYFFRMWVLQETYHVKGIMVLCGPYVLKWDDITSASRALENTCLGRLLVEFVEKLESSSMKATRIVPNSITNISFFEDIGTSDRLNMETLLGYTRFFAATDPRDRVFAVLGMWTATTRSKEREEVIKPKYVLAVNQIYARASWVAMHETNDLNLLSLVEREREPESPKKPEDMLPSWIPDYGVSPLAEPLSGPPGGPRPSIDQAGWWTASDGLLWEVPGLPEPDGDWFRLPVKGVCVDFICECGPSDTELLDKYQYHTLLELLLHCIKTDVKNADRSIEAFWRALVKNTCNGMRAGERTRELFSSVLVTKWVYDVQEAIDSLKSQNNSTSNDEINELLAAQAKLESLIKQLSRKDTSGTIRSWESIRKDVDKDNEDDWEANELQGRQRDRELIWGSFLRAYLGRRLFRTNGNRLGIGSHAIREGDEVWVLAGAAVPMVLKRNGKRDERNLVGEAYVHGIMYGEAVKDSIVSKIDLV